MTRLVSDTEMVALYKRLNTLEVLAEDAWDHPDQQTLGNIHSEVKRIRDEILRWSSLRPMEDGTEILGSKVVGECGTHGLFYLDDKRTAVHDGDCPCCEIEEMERTEEAR
jgi:hypothetical protein